jgi:hypothetical protein
MYLEPALEARLRARADAEGLTISEYVERLVHDEDADVAHTEALMREAAESGDYIELTPEDEFTPSRD